MKTFHFKIQIKDIQKPPVWREIAVPTDITFETFHQVIQAAFGWQDYHLYVFSLYKWDAPFYKIPDDEYDKAEQTKDSRVVKISEVFTKPNQTFTYVYDFGDNWEHSIILEDISDEPVMNAICTKGKGACPPEDAGGIPGYAYLIEILNDPKRPEHKEMKSWLGMKKDDKWDVNEFDIVAANKRCVEVVLT